jgi:hypothetical protein
MNREDRIEWSERHNVNVGDRYASWGLATHEIAILETADVDGLTGKGEYVLKTSNGFTWYGSFKEFVHHWDKVV